MTRQITNPNDRPVRWTNGEVLRRYREHKGLTQTQVAEAVGAYQKSVSEWEIGYNIPRPFTIRKLADLLDIPIAELI